ncbi:hypothetical protein BDQ17DRAFT_1435851 [Cyathus striatus]|nr:hypothetical protein BDQ17DRAFT_1435851 [Cyathus striatus]
MPRSTLRQQQARELSYSYVQLYKAQLKKNQARRRLMRLKVPKPQHTLALPANSAAMEPVRAYSSSSSTSSTSTSTTSNSSGTNLESDISEVDSTDSELCSTDTVTSTESPGSNFEMDSSGGDSGNETDDEMDIDEQPTRQKQHWRNYDSDSSDELSLPAFLKTWPYLRHVCKELEQLYAHRYLAPCNPFPRGPPALPHLLHVLKHERPDHFHQELHISPFTFEHLVQSIVDDPVFCSSSNIAQVPVEDQVAITLYQFGHYGNAAGLDKIAKWAGEIKEVREDLEKLVKEVEDVNEHVGELREEMWQVSNERDCHVLEEEEEWENMKEERDQEVVAYALEDMRATQQEMEHVTAELDNTKIETVNVRKDVEAKMACLDDSVDVVGKDVKVVGDDVASLKVALDRLKTAAIGLASLLETRHKEGKEYTDDMVCTVRDVGAVMQSLVESHLEKLLNLNREIPSSTIEGEG